MELDVPHDIHARVMQRQRQVGVHGSPMLVGFLLADGGVRLEEDHEAEVRLGVAPGADGAGAVVDGREFPEGVVVRTLVWGAVCEVGQGAGRSGGTVACDLGGVAVARGDGAVEAAGGNGRGCGGEEGEG